MIKHDNFVFRPSKNYLVSKNDYPRRFYPKKAKSLIKSQKIFNIYRPVRPFTKFIKQKICGTGLDPTSVFVRFINNDPIKPLAREENPIQRNFTFSPPKNMRWSIGTTCHCNNKDLLPKIDPYKEYTFTEVKEKKMKQKYLDTDHISIKVPDRLEELQKNKEERKNLSILDIKNEFHFNMRSGSDWSPRVYTVGNNNFNRSSVNYNIITHKDNNISGKQEISLLEKTVNNKKKGIGEQADLQRTFEPNYSPKFKKFYNEHKNGFKRYKGFFTELYDSCGKNGNIYKPFATDGNK